MDKKCHQDLGLLEKDKAVNCQLQFNIIHALIKVCPGHYGSTKERQTSDLQVTRKLSRSGTELVSKGQQEVADEELEKEYCSKNSTMDIDCLL